MNQVFHRNLRAHAGGKSEQVPLGIDLSRKAIVIVKSSNHFSAAFSKIAAAIHYLDSGGPFPHDPLAVTYKRVRRPIAPLDANPWA